MPHCCSCSPTPRLCGLRSSSRWQESNTASIPTAATATNLIPLCTSRRKSWPRSSSLAPRSWAPRGLQLGQRVTAAVATPSLGSTSRTCCRAHTGGTDVPVQSCQHSKKQRSSAWSTSRRFMWIPAKSWSAMWATWRLPGTWGCMWSELSLSSAFDRLGWRGKSIWNPILDHLFHADTITSPSITKTAQNIHNGIF